MLIKGGGEEKSFDPLEFKNMCVRYFWKDFFFNKKYMYFYKNCMHLYNKKMCALLQKKNV